MVPMRRGGVLIERCTECGGIYLDRGELEKIMAGERRSIDAWDDDDDDYDDDYERDRGRGRRKSRKRSFFEEIFDIG
jgi:Zn-finger nucleic acid-binding protein